MILTRLLQVFYELMCLSNFTDFSFVIPNAPPLSESYPLLTGTKWFGKSLCKIPLYMELIFYYRKDTNMHEYLAFSYFKNFLFFPASLILYYLLYANLIVYIGIIIFLIVSFAVAYRAEVFSFNSMTTIFLVCFVVEIIGTYITYTITKQPHFIRVKFVFLLVHLLFVSLIVGIAFEIPKDIPPPVLTIATKVAWKVVTITSVLTYLIYTTQYYKELHFLLLICSPVLFSLQSTSTHLFLQYLTSYFLYYIIFLV